jgi:hypothetical protein
MSFFTSMKISYFLRATDSRGIFQAGRHILMFDKKKDLRKSIFVDSKVQGALIGRVVLYWITCLIAIALMLLFWNIFTGPPRKLTTHLDILWLVLGPPAIASLLILPLVIMDVIRISNRFVGPLGRLRRSIRALARGENVEPMEFRNSDFWREFADDFNAIRARIRRLSNEKKIEKESHVEDEEPLGIGF